MTELSNTQAIIRYNGVARVEVTEELCTYCESQASLFPFDQLQWSGTSGSHWGTVYLLWISTLTVSIRSDTMEWHEWKSLRNCVPTVNLNPHCFHSIRYNGVARVEVTEELCTYCESQPSLFPFDQLQWSGTSGSHWGTVYLLWISTLAVSIRSDTMEWHDWKSLRNCVPTVNLSPRCFHSIRCIALYRWHSGHLVIDDW